MNTSSLDWAGVYLTPGFSMNNQMTCHFKFFTFFFPQRSLSTILCQLAVVPLIVPRGSLTVSLSITFQINTSHRRSCEIEFPHRKKKRGKKRWSCKAEGLTLFLVTAHWITCRHASGALRDTEQSWPTRAKPQRLQAVLCVPVLVNCWTENISITVINSIIK